MAVSHRCVQCDINWYPYQTQKGQCPQCGSGVSRVQADASPNAARLFKEHQEAKRRRELHEAFEVYYAKREQERADALQPPTEEIEDLEQLLKLSNDPPENPTGA